MFSIFEQLSVVYLHFSMCDCDKHLPYEQVSMIEKCHFDAEKRSSSILIVINKVGAGREWNPLKLFHLKPFQNMIVKHNLDKINRSRTKDFFFF